MRLQHSKDVAVKVFEVREQSDTGDVVLVEGDRAAFADDRVERLIERLDGDRADVTV
jgi:hypothetical protein